VLQTLGQRWASIKDIPGTRQVPRSVVIMATPDLAKWLSNDTFISKFLSGLEPGPESSFGEASEVSVLAGVVDAIPSHDRQRVEHLSGLSVLYGSESELGLPELWQNTQPRENPDMPAAVSFVCNSLHAQAGEGNGLEVTLPLANTIFSNGRRSTLFASRWSIDYSAPSNGPLLRCEDRRQTSHQRIATLPSPTARPNFHVPLFSVTPPRRISSCLGNIIRQVEIDGVAQPASSELEQLIPSIYEQKLARHPEALPEPIKVWALTVPPYIIKSRPELLNDVRVADQTDGENGTSGPSSTSTTAFQELLSLGCRAHRVLSGGGGWGAKKGLLSLDPDVSYAPREQDSVESFIKSFEARGDLSVQDHGLVNPGSYVMFCVQSSALGLAEEDRPKWKDEVSDMTLGVAASRDGEVTIPQEGRADGPIGIIRPGFGAFSASGLYLRALSAGISNESEHTNGRMKLDIPGALLVQPFE
jgi:hypothetical protein